MRFVPLVAPLILLAPLAALADEASFTGRLDTLFDHVVTREAAIPATPSPVEALRLKALDRAVTALVRPSTSPAGDLSTVAKVAASLYPSYPYDEEFNGDLDATLDGFDADHDAVAVRLRDFIDAMDQDDRRRTRSEAGLRRAALYRMDAAATPDRVARARLLQKAVKTLDAAWKAAVNPTGALRKYLVPASSWTAAATAGGVPLQPDMVACSFFPGFGYMDLILSEQTKLKSLPFRLVDVRVRGITGPGTYTLRFTDIGVGAPRMVPGGVLADCPSADDCRVFTTVDSAVYNGVLTITTFDTGRRIIAGTFSFKGKESGVNGGERDVTGGSFEVGYRLQTKVVSTFP